jgi:hypothetical protein
MPKLPCRWRSLTPARRLVIELMRASRGIPTVIAERRMELAELRDARRLASVRPAWSVIVAKAFAVVAATTPALRTSYMSFPWPHLCEHSEPVVAITVERQHQGDDVVLPTIVRGPHALSLAEVNAHLRHVKEAPVESVPSFRRSLRLGALPWPLRGWMTWLGVHASGRYRERFFGTFCVSSPAESGAGLLQLISPLACALHYGLFDEHGRLDVRLTFDHRVLDGAAAARCLMAMEGVLRGSILAEIRGLESASRAA